MQFTILPETQASILGKAGAIQKVSDIRIIIVIRNKHIPTAQPASSEAVIVITLVVERSVTILTFADLIDNRIGGSIRDRSNLEVS
jgi:hypothetical protein